MNSRESSSTCCSFRGIDEVGNVFEDDVLRHWDQMEQADNKIKAGTRTTGFRCCVTEEASKVTRGDCVDVEEKVLTF